MYICISILFNTTYKLKLHTHLSIAQGHFNKWPGETVNKTTVHAVHGQVLYQLIPLLIYFFLPNNAFKLHLSYLNRSEISLLWIADKRNLTVHSAMASGV